MVSQGMVLVTKGVIGGGIAGASHGYIISITEYTPPVDVPRRKGGSSYSEPNNKKLVTISCWAYGQVYTESVIVNKRTRISAKDIKIVESKDGKITILVNDIKTY